MTPTQANANRILIWMCVLIAVNQLGFGAVVPVIALSERNLKGWRRVQFHRPSHKVCANRSAQPLDLSRVGIPAPCRKFA